LPLFVALRFAPLMQRQPRNAPAAVVRIATAYDAIAFTEGSAGAPIVHTIPNAADVEALREDIASAKERADVVVVSWRRDLPFSGRKASSWDTKQKWPFYGGYRRRSSSAITLILSSPSKFIK
jgi:hypothetical protein